jgi:hypothetical protein
MALYWFIHCFFEVSKPTSNNLNDIIDICGFTVTGLVLEIQFTGSHTASHGTTLLMGLSRLTD